MNEWINLIENKPDEDETVLFCSKGCNVFLGKIYKDKIILERSGWVEFRSLSEEELTHWKRIDKPITDYVRYEDTWI